jgi:hypothetical protein
LGSGPVSAHPILSPSEDWGFDWLDKRLAAWEKQFLMDFGISCLVAAPVPETLLLMDSAVVLVTVVLEQATYL